MSEKKKMEFFGGGWRQVEDTKSTEPSRIIDAHYHIFPRFESGSVAAEDALPLKLWQYHVRDFTDFWRKSDGKRVQQRLLDYPSDNIHEMSDVNFRRGRYGQADVTVDGVQYCMQLYPPLWRRRRRDACGSTDVRQMARIPLR